MATECSPQHGSEILRMWMIVTVETELDWPAKETSVKFMGDELWLRPSEDGSAADVRLQYEHPQAEREAYETICRFLSALSWWQHRPARAILRIACTAPMRGRSEGHGPLLCDDYCPPEDLQIPTDSKARIALALYREATSVQSTPYELLGYFKVINICYNKGEEQKAWINRAVAKLPDRDAQERVKELRDLHSVEDIGKYLYHSGRCAVAHAWGDPVVDPDKPDDLFRLSADMPVARALAEYLIEHELGVPWRSSKRTG